MAGDLLPYFKFYPAETLADERFSGWSLEERGGWLTLILHAWVNGSIPSDLDALARILHVDAIAMRSLWGAIGDRFTGMDHLPQGRLSSLRLEMEREDVTNRVEAGRKGAKSRWSKRKNRNATAMRPQCDRNAEPMPTEQSRAEQSRAEQKQEDLSLVPSEPQKGAVKLDSVEPLRKRLLGIVRSGGRAYVEKIAAERKQLREALKSPGVTEQVIEQAFLTVYARNFHLRIEQVALALTKAQELPRGSGPSPPFQALPPPSPPEEFIGGERDMSHWISGGVAK